MESLRRNAAGRVNPEHQLMQINAPMIVRRLKRLPVRAFVVTFALSSQLTAQQPPAHQPPAHQPPDQQVDSIQTSTSNYFASTLDPYRVRAAELPDEVTNDTVYEAPITLAPMWWEPMLAEPFGIAGDSLPVSIDSLIQMAIASSPHVQSILTEPAISQTEITIADAVFDTTAFVESKFSKLNDPVGSTLTTGDNSSRFRDEILSSSAGVRDKFRSGGQFSLSQRAGYQDNNSLFLLPNPQGTTRLELSFTQPLMKDRGRAFNQTQILVARLNARQATSLTRAQLESHLVDVARTYWDLYQTRAEWLQRTRLLGRAEELHEILASRQGIDSHQRQVLKANTAITSRRSELVRAETRIRNLQSRLRMLTGTQRNTEHNGIYIEREFRPQDQPNTQLFDVSLRQSVITALEHRADINQSIRELQVLSARVGAAKNQVMPRLDLILSSYVAGLDGNRSSLRALESQFTGGTPSYAAGILFEMPAGNRASRARLQRNQLEFNRAMFDFQQTTEVVFTEVEVAARETTTAFGEIVAKSQSIAAQNREVEYLKQRWELLPDPNESAVLLIDDLFDAQQRLADEERAYVAAQVAYAMSWVQLRKSMGVLLQFDPFGNLDTNLPNEEAVLHGEMLP